MVDKLDHATLEENLTKSKLVLLHGLPGIGKTSHVIEYVHKKSELEDWNVQWFSVET